MMKKLIKFSAIPVLAVAFSAPALATPKSYVVDPTHSFANFSYTHMGLSEQESRFDGTSGTIVYDAAAKTGAVNVEIDTTSVDTGSDATGRAPAWRRLLRFVQASEGHLQIHPHRVQG
ncbi:YceI family protein [Lautropia mirabilis]